ncbi:MAG TPA: sigma 54-interacting transcriptional regulator [Polyangiaceae bacterium]|nr:sigma 54-interacting transcriptional regulator [Polyangiaceae bacterium]
MANVAIEVLSGSQLGKVLRSEADVIRIGRAPSSDLPLTDAHVSAQHARLLVGSSEVVLEDLGSSNGTWLVRAGKRTRLSEAGARVVAVDGDELELGGEGDQGTRLRLQIAPDRETGQLLAVRPLADLEASSNSLDEAPRLRALLAALRAIGGEESLEAAAGAVASAALVLVPRATHAAVLLRDESVPVSETVTHGLLPLSLRVRAADGKPCQPPAPFAIPRSILRKVLRERAAVVVADAPNEAMSSESLLGASIYSTMGIPLWKGEEVLGVLQVDSRGAPAMFGSADVNWLGVLAANASLAIANARLIQRLSSAGQALKKENTFLRRRERARSDGGEIVGKSRAMSELFAQLDKVVDTRVSVLIHGETGTGKELIASALHQRSKRRDKLFVAQNCAAFPENLLESELFGHKRGAFTGATEEKKGLFEIADGGTLFLDEIGEMPLTLQGKLLRALQEGEVRQVGGTTTKQVDVRIVAATNRDLDVEVRAGRFREDLYYRLRVFPVRVPPLRERRDDVPLLARYFLARYTAEFGKSVEGFTDAALNVLSAHDWPGNVRELENEVQRLVIQADPGEAIDAPLLSPRIRQVEDLLLGAGTAKGTLREMVDQVERQILIEALREHGNNKTAAAKTLGITREGLHKKLKQLGVG